MAKYFNPKNHINNLIDDKYYNELIKLRNETEKACDEYFQKLNAPKIDLYMLARNVSSPTGRGSDSKPIPIKISKQQIYLVDSAQFGMEPLVIKNNKMVYCYLPSFRGEDADEGHLNQFYHCEAELRGDLNDVISVVNGLVKHLLKIYANSNNKYFVKKFIKIKNIINKDFPVVTFDDACELLEKNKLDDLIEKRSYGRVLSRKAELALVKIITDNKVPLWISHYDRDTVAFYQKPNPKNPHQVLNADLIFPPINGGFGGEIVGCGQRQDDPKEIIESMKRQKITDWQSYKWYIDLRKHSKYTHSSGFGIGIERFLAWVLEIQDIADVAIYPVRNNDKLFY